MPAYSGRTMMKKYLSERKGRPKFDTALHYNTVDMIATEKKRAAKSAVRYEPVPVCNGMN